jgi:hypothetical protein
MYGTAGRMREIASAIIDCPIPFHGNRKERLVRFYREIAGVGLVFPRADHPIAVEFPGYPVVRLRHIAGIRYVEEAVTALGSSTELAGHLFRECWAEGTGSEVDLCRAFGWEVEAHAFKVAMAADLVALWQLADYTNRV